MLHKVCYIYPYVFLISCFVGDEQFFFSHVSLANIDTIQKISFSVKNVNLKIVVSKCLHILFNAYPLLAANAYIVGNSCSKNILQAPGTDVLDKKISI